MLISRLHHPVKALGYGTRAGVWVQGCGIGCPGCVATDTWPVLADRDVPVGRLVGWLRERPGAVDGVTISGGEPTDQPEDLRQLLTRCREVAAERGEIWDLLVYSGRSTAAAWRRCPWLAQLADAVVTGPFRVDRPSADPLRGSANQQVVTLTPVGMQRYGPDAERLVRRMDVVVDNGNVLMVGIPRRGDLERLAAGLADRGITFQSVSWAP